MKLFNLSLLSILLLFCACQDQNKKLYDEVMAVHDEVMPRMNDLYKAKTSLQKQLGDSSLSEERKQAISASIVLIDSASDGMMVWMRKFDPESRKGDKEQTRIYLEEELIKVGKVRDDILRALEHSNP